MRARADRATPGVEPLAAREGHASGRLPGPAALLRLSRLAGNTAVTGMLTAQRSGSMPRTEKLLRDVQGEAMFALLPALADLPADALDESVAVRVGGQRLVEAIRAVKAKKAGRDWLGFAHGESGALATVFGGRLGDQLTAIVDYLGAPKNARYYTRENFGDRFDGAVDPVAKQITLMFKVRLDFTNATGSPAWTPAAEKLFTDGFTKAVEEGWSGKGNCAVKTPGGGGPAFGTRVQVVIAAADPHCIFKVWSKRTVGSHADPLPDAGKPIRGELGWGDNQPEIHEELNLPDGSRVKYRTVQVVTAHEAGHAFGLFHVNGPGGDTWDYGETPEQQSDIMGRGDRVQVQIQKSGMPHNDLHPFGLIADKWTAELYPGRLAVECQ